jgi:uncharacterized protein YggE
MKRLAIAAAALAALAALLGTLSTRDAAAVEATDTKGVTVQGTATASAVPSEALLTLGVESRADTAKAALAANAAAMRKVIDAVEAAGGEDVGTQSVWLNPWQDENGPAGYVATNTVSTKVSIAKAGALIDAGVAAGANQVSGPSMSVDDEQALYREALAAAVDDARARANAIADAAGVSLGRVTAVVENGSAPQPYPLERAAVAQDSSTPVEPGRREVSATVTVTFAIA